MKTPTNGPARNAIDWSRCFGAPVRLKMRILHTGEVHTDGNIHFNKKSPKFKSMPREDRFNPVLVFLVEHPEKGHLLLDTGLHHSFAETKLGNFGPLLGRLVKGRTQPGKDVRSQLSSLGLAPGDIRAILLSHLHLDHTSGLPYFVGSRNVDIYVDAEELAAASAPLSFAKGYVKSHWKGIGLKAIPFGGGASPFRQACDLFGDGSVIAVRTAGHTRGHTSVVLNAAGGPIVLAFDAVHRRANMDANIPPSGDYGEALSAMEGVGSFLAAYPKSRMVYGHDPDQLASLTLAPECYS